MNPESGYLLKLLGLDGKMMYSSRNIKIGYYNNQKKLITYWYSRIGWWTKVSPLVGGSSIGKDEAIKVLTTPSPRPQTTELPAKIIWDRFLFGSKLI